MISKIKHIFKRAGSKGISGYESLSDFLVNAPDNRKNEVLREVAQKSNRDQMKTFAKAKLEIESL